MKWNWTRKWTRKWKEKGVDETFQYFHPFFFNKSLKKKYYNKIKVTKPNQEEALEGLTLKPEFFLVICQNWDNLIDTHSRNIIWGYPGARDDYHGKHFIRSIEFDENLSQWSWYWGNHKNCLEKFVGLFRTKKIDSQNCKNLTFKVIFLRQKLSKSLRKKNSLKNINLGQQLLLKSFFDKFNFKNNLLLKLGCKIVIFLNLTTLFEKLQKFFWCNFCASTSIRFIVISFHQIPLTWWNAYWCRVSS